eukprot:scaffold14267_cov55-Phaeocystis_antarctica.AAC.4
MSSALRATWVRAPPPRPGLAWCASRRGWCVAAAAACGGGRARGTVRSRTGPAARRARRAAPRTRSARARRAGYGLALRSTARPAKVRVRVRVRVRVKVRVRVGVRVRVRVRTCQGSRSGRSLCTSCAKLAWVSARLESCADGMCAPHSWRWLGSEGVSRVQRVAAVARERESLRTHVCAVVAVDEGEGEVETDEDAAALQWG